MANHLMTFRFHDETFLEVELILQTSGLPSRADLFGNALTLLYRVFQEISGGARLLKKINGVTHEVEFPFWKTESRGVRAVNEADTETSDCISLSFLFQEEEFRNLKKLAHESGLSGGGMFRESIRFFSWIVKETQQEATFFFEKDQKVYPLISFFGSYAFRPAETDRVPFL